MEAQSGSGTLAGNAHADSFEELVSGTAAAISNVVNVQWARPLLQKAFPGQRIYAYFTMAADLPEDTAEPITISEDECRASSPRNTSLSARQTKGKKDARLIGIAPTHGRHHCPAAPHPHYATHP